MAREVEEQVDALYKLPLGEFTAARQALAKTLSGDAAARVKSLAKPHVAAWAANQVYWQARPVYERLLKAAERLRSAHKAALTGRTANLREADEAHHSAVRDAVREAVSVLERDGRPVSAATNEAIARTMAALPADEAPGRLDRPLSPAGFEALAGIVPSGKAVGEHPTERLGALRLVHSRTRGESDGRKAPEPPKVPRRQIEAARRDVAKAEAHLRDVQRDARKAETQARRAAQALSRARATRERIERELEEADDTTRQTEAESRRLARDAEQRAAEARRAERELGAARERLEELGGKNG